MKEKAIITLSNENYFKVNLHWKVLPYNLFDQFCFLGLKMSHNYHIIFYVTSMVNNS